MSVQNSINSAIGSLTALGAVTRYFGNQKQGLENQKKEISNQEKIISNQDKQYEQMKKNVANADNIENNLLAEAETLQKYREDNPEDYEGYEELVNQIAQERPGVARIWEQQTKVPAYITENAVAQSQAVQER